MVFIRMYHSVVKGMIAFCMLGTINLYSADAEVQATSRPLGLDVVNLVQKNDSDAASINFRDNILTNIVNYVDDHTSIQGSFSVPVFNQVDPATFTAPVAGLARVYYVGGTNTRHNSLGYSRGNDFSLNPGDPKLVFPDASTNLFTRTASSSSVLGQPLIPGDFVELGPVALGEKINFFLIPDGAEEPAPGQAELWWTDPAQNFPSDALQHALAVVPAGTDILLYGWEDRHSLDQQFDGDFNDLFIALQIIPTSAAVPEPETYLILVSFLLFVACIRKKQKPQKAHCSISNS
ncbi:MAG: hypothetical protein CMO81_02385 [Waddliaceae bacterium]|nr:hypothetical protein [Waddliaceae bacterium]